jgi:hypothetical protein
MGRRSGDAEGNGERQLKTFPPSPFVLSLSKHRFFFGQAQRQKKKAALRQAQGKRVW